MRALALTKSHPVVQWAVMNIRSDTNIFLAVALGEPEKDNIIQLTSASDAIAPEILPYEIGNALTAMVKRKQLTHDEALSAFDAASSIPVRLVSVDIKKALKLALDYNIYAYDAYFLQCAIYLSTPLITLDKRMKKIAHDLVKTIRSNASIDWAVKDSVRAKMRVLIKRILKKYGYPPDKQEKATQTVLSQAELLCHAWAA